MEPRRAAAALNSCSLLSERGSEREILFFHSWEGTRREREVCVNRISFGLIFFVNMCSVVYKYRPSCFFFVCVCMFQSLTVHGHTQWESSDLCRQLWRRLLWQNSAPSHFLFMVSWKKSPLPLLFLHHGIKMYPASSAVSYLSCHKLCGPAICDHK